MLHFVCVCFTGALFPMIFIVAPKVMIAMKESNEPHTKSSGEMNQSLFSLSLQHATLNAGVVWCGVM